MGRTLLNLGGNPGAQTTSHLSPVSANGEVAYQSGGACSAHMFQHTASVPMAQADVPMQKISQYLGHTSTRITERVYARYSPSFMEDASAALDW